MKLFICEKPSQAADLAKVLGGARRTDTHWETDGGRVTWCVGHLLETAEPEDYNPDLKQWHIGKLPIIPERFRYKPTHGMGGRLKEIGALLKQASSAVVATDAGREGEVIGREVLEFHNWRGGVERLWLGAMDPESVRKALGKMKPGESSINTFRAGRARIEGDWLVGINVTRALTSTSPRGNGVTSAGRVQSPTLALVVKRDREIDAFRPRDYFEIEAVVSTASGDVTLRYAPDEARRIYERPVADQIAQSVSGQAVTVRRTAETKRKAPPKLYALSDLQRECSRRWGWPAKKTLGVAQALYERHKATTYPRSGCNYLPEEQIPDVPVIWGNVTGLVQFQQFAGRTPTPRAAVFDTKKVGEHNAIVPTLAKPDLGAMDEDERRAYLLIAASYVASLLPDYEYLATELSAAAGGVVFAARGITPMVEGWREAFEAIKSERKPADEDGASEDEDDARRVPDIEDGTAGRVDSAEVIGCRTKPPPHYTEGTLIADMIGISKYVTNPEHRARLKETDGIGTEATRADIIETLKRNDYIATRGKKLLATPKGCAFVDRVAREMPELIDPGETALMELELEAVASGAKPASDYVAKIAARVRGYVAGIAATTPAASQSQSQPTGTRVEVEGAALFDNGDYFTTAGVKGRLYKQFVGHTFTAEEFGRMLNGEVLTLTDCSTKAGVKLGPRRVRFNGKKKPFPGVEFED